MTHSICALPPCPQHCEAIQKAQAEIQRLRLERERYEDSMKKAFMRGVCALNMEALSMFHGPEGRGEQPPAHDQHGPGHDGRTEIFLDIIPQYNCIKAALTHTHTAVLPYSKPSRLASVPPWLHIDRALLQSEIPFLQRSTAACY